MDLDKLVLERVIFEARYVNGFLYWDTCGQVWREIFTRFPAMREVAVDVNKAELRIDEHSLNLTFSNKQLNVQQDYPKDLKVFKQFTDEAVHLISSKLQIETYTRLGNRFTYVVPLPDVEATATAWMLKTGFFAHPPNKLTKFGSQLREPELKFVLQDEDMGIIVRLSALERNLEIRIPPPLSLDDSRFIKMGIFIDLDRFTRKPLDLEKLRVQEWIETNERNLRKTITELFS